MPQNTIHRLRIELRHIRPKIWRRIEVPSEYTFWDLHSAIQDAMGWYDSHLHEFRVGPRREITIGTSDEDPNEVQQASSGGGRRPLLSSDDARAFHELEAIFADRFMSALRELQANRRLLDRETPIADHLAKKGDTAVYAYDFGDDWLHDVRVVAIAPRAAGAAYPVCVDGRRACPPEDCGGPWNYADFLAALADPKHEEHENSTWVGAGFDPEQFDKAAVHFRDPQERLKAWRKFGRL